MKFYVFYHAERDFEVRSIQTIMYLGTILVIFERDKI